MERVPTWSDSQRQESGLLREFADPLDLGVAPDEFGELVRQVVGRLV